MNDPAAGDCPARLREIAALREKATEGPWRVQGGPAEAVYVLTGVDDYLTGPIRENNAAFIAAAANLDWQRLAEPPLDAALDAELLADALHAKVCGPFTTIDPQQCLGGRARDVRVAEAIAAEYARLRARADGAEGETA